MDHLDYDEVERKMMASIDLAESIVKPELNKIAIQCGDDNEALKERVTDLLMALALGIAVVMAKTTETDPSMVGRKFGEFLTNVIGKLRRDPRFSGVSFAGLAGMKETDHGTETEDPWSTN